MICSVARRELTGLLELFEREVDADDAGKEAMVSNSPVWCPMLSIKQSAPSFKTPVSRLANFSDPVTLSMSRPFMGISVAPCTPRIRNMVGGLVDLGLACPTAEGET
jgi:hypothetical protein